MKKGIECQTTFDPSGNWMLRIFKKKGKLTLDEIIATATEYEQDYYGLVLKCMDDDMMQYWDDDVWYGDVVELYSISDMLQLVGKAKAK